MCLAKVYVRSEAAEELVMENVTHVTVNDGHILLKSLLEESKEVEGKIASIDLMGGKVVLRAGEA
jgi:predicted RNA-binding protein